MTYCVAMCLSDGLVFASDSRTNAGVDHIATFKKLHVFHQDGERVMVLQSAGNLATTQSVITSWSQFQELKATGSNGQTLFYKEEGFKDAYRLALGTTYYYDDNWTFRTGIAFDDSPVPANNRSISIPDQDRLWLSAGTTYAFNKDASVDVGVSYMHGQHVEIKEGPYTFRSEGTAWLYGANFNYRF